MKFRIAWFPGKETTFLYLDYGAHFTQGTDHLFVKTHEPYNDKAMQCICKGTWNARNEFGCAVHFCNDNPTIEMIKTTKELGE